jgi:hypothetical protein
MKLQFDDAFEFEEVLDLSNYSKPTSNGKHEYFCDLIRTAPIKYIEPDSNNYLDAQQSYESYFLKEDSTSTTIISKSIEFPSHLDPDALLYQVIDYNL